MIYYTTCFLSAFLACYLFNYPIRAISIRNGFYDQPENRKLHRKEIPYGGGVAFYLALVFALVLIYYIYPPAFLFRGKIQGLLLGGLVVVLFGLWDDLKGSGAIIKFMAEALVGIIMYQCGFRIEHLNIPVIGTVSLGWTGVFITILWFWVMMNAINLIDGMDGLASGVTAISAITIMIITFNPGSPFETFLALIIIGICIGFLPHNFHPAKIFMGDAGSLFLGFLLGSLTLSSSTKAPALLTLIIPFLAVGMPIFDTSHAFFRRILSGKHPFRADRKHLHHRLLALGLSHRRTVLFLYYISGYLGVMAFILSKASAQSAILVVVLLMFGLLLLAENIASIVEMKAPEGNLENIKENK
jgi:UDP-GlcNAc:undecaprenyl-phosphate/decaprenyl-phosphate GlcNAc-1-phosphate transferase